MITTFNCAGNFFLHLITLEQLCTKWDHAALKVDARPRMSENNANYYGVKMHHSEHRSFIQETSEKGKIQIQDHVKKRKECVIAESRFTSGAKNATMTEYPGGVHE